MDELTKRIRKALNKIDNRYDSSSQMKQIVAEAVVGTLEDHPVVLSNDITGAIAQVAEEGIILEQTSKYPGIYRTVSQNEYLSREGLYHTTLGEFIGSWVRGKSSICTLCC
jgi:uncharacterized protein (DUF2344 family)